MVKLYRYYYTANSLKSKFSKQQKCDFYLKKSPSEIILAQVQSKKGIFYVSTDKLLGRDQT